jgi:hypothetical protein
MRKRVIAAGLIAAGVAGPCAAASAQPALQNVPRGAVSQMSSSGFYIWVDGTVQRINLPSYRVGPISADLTTGVAIGPLNNFDQRLSGAGVAAAAGYVFRDGIFAPGWGSNVRVELGASRVQADATGSAAGTLTAIGRQLLNGLDTGGACVPFCNYGTTLQSDFKSMQYHLQAASDFRAGNVTLSPALAVFTTSARSHQAIATSIAGVANPYYAADTTLEWHDWGARAGLDGKLEVTPWMTIGLGGTIGLVRRDVDFAGSDTYNAPFAASSISRSTDTTAFLANAEASITLRPAPAAAVRAFAGLNYDSRVPGILPASYTGSYIAPTSITAANILFSHETSWYAGGGMVITFAP